MVGRDGVVLRPPLPGRPRRLPADPGAAAPHPHLGGGRLAAPGPLRRAARFEGSCPLKVGDSGELVVLDPGDVRELRSVIDRRRADPSAPFDVMVGGSTPEDPAAARAMLAPLAEAGMTWWQECVDPRQTDLEGFRRRVRQGPPGA